MYARAKFEVLLDWKDNVYYRPTSYKGVFGRSAVENGSSEMGVENLKVDHSTVCRTVQVFEETGSVDSIQGFHENTSKKLDDHDEMVILEAVLESPFMYLHEIQNTLLQTTGTNVSTATLCKFLHSQGFFTQEVSFQSPTEKGWTQSTICIRHLIVWATRLSM